MCDYIHYSGAPPTGGEEGGVANFDDITKEFNEGYSNHLSLAIDEVCNYYYYLFNLLFVSLSD